MRSLARRMLYAAPLLPLATGCGSSAGPETNAPQVNSSTAALVPLRTCNEVNDAVRSGAARAMKELLETKRQEALAALANGNCYLSSYRYEELDYVLGAPAGAGVGGSATTAAPSSSTNAAPSSGTASPSEVSSTNNQVAGVDEADFIKNDEEGYLYLLADGALQIVDGWPPAETRVLSRVPLEDEPKRLFVEGDRLLVFSSVPKAASETSQYQSWWYQKSGECTYGYDCDFTGDGQSTRISLFDISDRAAPRLLRTLETSATFISARKVGSTVHVVLYQEPELLRKLPIVPVTLESEGLCSGTEVIGTGTSSYQQRVPAAGDEARVDGLFAQLEQENLTAIQNASLEELLGRIEDRLEDGTSRGRDLESCAGFYDSPRADGTAFLTLLSLDLNRALPAQTSTIISRPGASYASAEAYYISVRQQPGYGYWFYDSEQIQEASTVHKFSLGPASNQYLASGVVKGRVLNQFSLDEWKGDLRIATTSGHLPSPDVHSTLSILRQNGSELELVGQVDQIAPQEDIRSVRFLGDRGYVVTFKKTDPLFVFELGDPAHPRAVGELKIPGFSTYLHPLDSGHLMSIGYDSDDQENFAWFTGLLLQIFDVSNSASPQLVAREVIGARGSSSEAATNHLAFNYFAPRQILAVPATVCEDSAGGGSYAQTMTFSGVLLYRVNPTEGFSLAGRVAHPYVDPQDSSRYYVGGECSNWWTESNSVVQRTVFMDDFVYSVSALRIKVNDLGHLEPDLADVPLVVPSGSGG